MNAQQHHAEAERLLDNDGGRLQGERAAQLALVHATLALSAPREVNVSLAGAAPDQSQRLPVEFTAPEVVRTGVVSAETARDIEAWRKERNRESFMYGTQDGAAVGPFTREQFEDEIADGSFLFGTVDGAAVGPFTRDAVSPEREPLDPELNRTEPEPRYDFAGNELGLDEHDWRL